MALLLLKSLSAALLRRQWYLGVAESCTGGALAASLTSVPGSSSWFERGLITYSNLSKQQLLGVATSTLQTFGAVSEATAREMVGGVLAHAPVQIAVAITGIAGPEGGTAEKPVGTVFIAWQDILHPPRVQQFQFSGGRQDVQQQATTAALQGLLSALEGEN